MNYPFISGKLIVNGRHQSLQVIGASKLTSAPMEKCCRILIKNSRVSWIDSCKTLIDQYRGCGNFTGNAEIDKSAKSRRQTGYGC